MKGEFFYKRGKGFLWKYSAPTEKIFLYDGNAVWQAEEDKPYVIKEKVDKEKMEGSFLDLVDDVTRLDKLFTVKETIRQDEVDHDAAHARRRRACSSRPASGWTANYLIKQDGDHRNHG